MKKTVTVNLDKNIFNIDDDAYDLLAAYLQSLNDHFAHEEGGQEILNDIESRIAELFKERLGYGMQVITRQEVTEVISIMGRPDEIENPLEGETIDETPHEADHETTDSAETQAEAPRNESAANETTTTTPRRRRLYRDPDNRILGGVASGIGYYLGIDVVFIRVFLVLLLPLWASSIWIYLLLWICIPEARTTAQKIEMRGETPTIDNIRRAVEEEHDNNRTNSSMNSFGHTLGEIFRGVFKFFFICIGALIAISIIGALVTCIISLLAFIFLGTTVITTPFISIFPGNIEVLNGNWELVLFTVSLLLTFGIPLYAILRAVLGSIFHWKAQPLALNITLLVLWLLSLVALFFATFIALPTQSLLVI
ncbi:MAG TPA: PspC domain-containing protein [Candidatus Barnesiella merdipullorum]|nr:PspC domain-containing protein [Candidatus Barnesiella merdipullorum]